MSKQIQQAGKSQSSGEASSTEIEKELEKRSWALSALSEAAAALARADSQDLLVKEVCAAIAAQGPYVLAWVGKAEDCKRSWRRWVCHRLHRQHWSQLV
jgi:hypothetical protein